MKNRRWLRYGLLCFCLAGAVLCGWNIYQEMKPRVLAEQVYDQIRKSVFQESTAEMGGGADPSAVRADTRIRPDFETLLQWNPDIVGWIWSPNSDIDYPVVQGRDNDYYLNHTADGVNSIIGSIFMESNNRKEFQDDVTILYGHHIRGGRMFSSLSGYKTQSYYEEHPILFLYTPDKDYQVALFAGETLNGQDASFPMTFESTHAREVWLKKLLASPTFRSPVEVEEHQRILALCTCSYEYNNARYVVYGILNDMEEAANVK